MIYAKYVRWNMLWWLKVVLILIPVSVVFITAAALANSASMTSEAEESVAKEIKGYEDYSIKQGCDQIP